MNRSSYLIYDTIEIKAANEIILHKNLGRLLCEA